MWFFCPIEGLPQSIYQFVLERTKLEFYSAQLWYITKWTKLIWKTWNDNGSQVPCVTRGCDNRMIQPL